MVSLSSCVRSWVDDLRFQLGMLYVLSMATLISSTAGDNTKSCVHQRSDPRCTNDQARGAAAGECTARVSGTNSTGDQILLVRSRYCKGDTGMPIRSTTGHIMTCMCESFTLGEIAPQTSQLSKVHNYQTVALERVVSSSDCYNSSIFLQTYLQQRQHLTHHDIRRLPSSIKHLVSHSMRPPTAQR